MYKISFGWEIKHHYVSLHPTGAEKQQILAIGMQERQGARNKVPHIESLRLQMGSHKRVKVYIGLYNYIWKCFLWNYFMDFNQIRHGATLP